MSTQPKKKSPREQVTLEFPDNGLLAGLAGPHQKNFARLEQKLGVRVATRGNLVAVEGASEARDQAAAVLRALYARLEAGEAANLSDVDAEIHFALEGPVRTAASGNFGSPSLKTWASRTTRGDRALSSDFIVGFPGESDKDFDATLALVGDVGYAQAYSFKYSKRPGTPASAARKQIPEDVKSARLAALQDLLVRQQQAFNKSCEGRTLSVLFEKPGRKKDQAVGRSPYLQPVHVEGAGALIGQIRDVRILEAQPNSLKGVLAQ